MGELHEKLMYVKDLVTAMDKLNQEEQGLLRQKKHPVTQNEVVVEMPQEQKGKKVLILIAVFVVLFVMNTVPLVSNLHKSQQSQIRRERLDAEFSWNLEHPGEEFPGYNDEPEESWVFTYFLAVARGFIISFIITGILALVLNYNAKSKRADAERRNERQRKQHQDIQKNNELIVWQNKEIDEKINQINNRRRLISQEYMENIIAWYPKDYGYLSAVEFFINLVENHLAETIQECVEQYNTHMFREEVKENQKDTQKIVITAYENIVRQQMIGNMIATANLVANMATAANTANIANNTSDIAHHTENISEHTRRVSNSVSNEPYIHREDINR